MTVDPVAALLEPGSYWTGPVTYGVPTSGSSWAAYSPSTALNEPYIFGFSVANAALSSAFLSAMAAWKQLIALDLQFVAEPAATADIRIAYTNVGPGVWGYAYFPPDQPAALPSAAHGDIWVSYVLKTTATFTRGDYDYESILHEIGHALGLKHPFQTAGGVDDVLPPELDNTRYTVMSYTPHTDVTRVSFIPGGGGTVTPQYAYVGAVTPMLLDIQAIQARYGANMSTATGNTTYTFDASAVLQTIWDAGGTDTFNLSTLPRGSDIDLRPGEYSSVAFFSKDEQTAYWLGLFSSPAARATIITEINGYSDTYEWRDNVAIAYNVDIENVIGSAYADNVLGNALANSIIGGAGNDTVNAGDGADTVLGGDGEDSINGGVGNDSIDGGVGNDSLNGGDGANTIAGGAGIDTITTGSGSSTIFGGDGNDVVFGGVGADSVDGGVGNDTIFVGAGDTAAGGVGDDDYRVTDLGGVLTEAAGQGLDRVEVLVGGAYTLAPNLEILVFSGSGDFSGTGNASDNQIVGGTWRNTLDGAGGNDLLTGQYNDDWLTGGAGNDTILGGEGADFINGGDGVDSLSGGLGLNRVWGGAGGDRINGGDNGNVLIGENGYDLASGWDLVTTGNDTINGGGSSDLLIGGLGNDILNGGDGDDRIVGGLAGADTWYGPIALAAVASGNDSINGGSGFDEAFLNYADRVQNITFVVNDITTGDQIFVGGVAQGSVISVETLTFFCGAGNDTISLPVGARTAWLDGGDGADTLTMLGENTFSITVTMFGETFSIFQSSNLLGGAGNDTLTGGAGIEIMTGGAGADAMDGGGGAQDRLQYAGSDAGVAINLAVHTASGGHAAGDTFASFEQVSGSSFNDTLIGDGQQNQLLGEAGADSLDGGDGDDTLDGGGGDDVLDGGAGADTITYASVASAPGVTVSLALQGGAQNTIGAGTDTLTGFENIIGSAFADALTGDGGANVLTGGEGNDTIRGGLGDDSIRGGAGDDLLYGAAETRTETGANTINGGVGNDFIVGGDGDDLMEGGDGDDILLSWYKGDDTAIGGLGDDFFQVAGNGSLPASRTLSFDGGEGGDRFSVNTNEGMVVNLDAGNGMDHVTLNVIQNGVTLNIDLGGSNDSIEINATASAVASPFGPQAITLTLGSNSDLVYFGSSQGHHAPANIIITDFWTGGFGDNLDFYELLTAYLTTWNGVANPFATGHVQLVQSGADTILRIDADASGTGFVAVDCFTFLNRTASAFTADNFFGIDPGGAAPTGVVLNYDTVPEHGAAGTLGNDNITIGGTNQRISGRGGDDVMHSTGYRNTLFGGAGDDTLFSSNGGPIGWEELFGEAGDDTLNGGAGLDWLDGGEGADHLLGNAGADFLRGDAGADVMEGGGGDDSYAVGDALDTIVELAGGGRDAVTIETGGFAITLADNVEDLFARTTISLGYTAIGNALNNALTGSDGADTLSGLGGVDTINGGVGNDTLAGGLGNDLVQGQADDDTFLWAAGDGRDTIDGGAGVDVLNAAGGASTDIARITWTGGPITALLDNALSSVETINLDLAGGVDWLIYTATSGVAVDFGAGAATGVASLANIENAIGGAGGDTLTGGGANNRLDGAAGDDTLSGAGGDDVLVGGDGADVLAGGLGNDSAQGDAGNDTFVWAWGDGRDTFNGGADTDTLNATGSAAADIARATWNGSAITNMLDGALLSIEAINLDLGAGVDWLVYTASAGVSVDLAAGTGSGFSSIVSVEKVIGGTGGDTLTGDAADNRLDGGAGNDTLAGAGGLDVLIGGDGADVLTGGADNDSSQGEAGNDTFVWVFGDGRDTFNGGADTDTLNATGGAAADVARATWNGAAVIALLDNALISIETTNLDLAGGVDWLAYNASVGVTVDLGAGTASGFSSLVNVEKVIGGSGGDALTGDGADNRLDGALGDDTLVGGGGADVLLGGDGADVLNGGLGNDSTQGDGGNDVFNWSWGEGRDTFNGGADTDTLNVTGSSVADVVRATWNGSAVTNMIDGVLTLIETINLDLAGGVDWLTYNTTLGVMVDFAAGVASGFASLANIENAIGAVGADTLTGSAAANRLDGAAGADTIDGGLGADVLVGGANGDSFVFSTVLGGGNVDSIFDFSVADDTILLETDIFAIAGALDADAFHIGTAAADAEDRIIYNSAAGVLFFDADGTGAGGSTAFATLGAGLALTEADFFGV